MSRPEYVKCVITAVGEAHPLYGKTWCGREHVYVWREDMEAPHASEFVFQNIDHAVVNAFNKGWTLICGHCAAAIKKVIDSGKARRR